MRRRGQIVLYLGLIISLFSISASLQAAPTYNGDATYYNGAAGAGTFGGSFTPSLGTNNILIVVVSTELAINYTVTYGGSAVTLLRSDCSGTACQYIYYLVNPAPGPLALAAAAVPNDWNTARILAFTYSSVNQTTPLGANAGTNATPGVSPWSLSMSITPTNANSVLVQVSNIQTGGCTPGSFSTSAGVSRYTNYNGIINTHGEAISDYAPGTFGTPVSFNHNYTCATGGASKFEIAAVELMPLVGTPTFTVTVTRTSTLTSTPTQSFTATSTVSPTASPTPTPRMVLTKTTNLNTATIGDTLTFCLFYSNDSSGVRTINLWDTISTFLTYVSCNNTCTHTGNIVSWSIASVAAGASGSVCFWGTVNGYPYMPELLAPPVMHARREDLEMLFGLLPNSVTQR